MFFTYAQENQIELYERKKGFEAFAQEHDSIERKLTMQLRAYAKPWLDSSGGGGGHHTKTSIQSLCELRVVTIETHTNNSKFAAQGSSGPQRELDPPVRRVNMHYLGDGEI